MNIPLTPSERRRADDPGIREACRVTLLAHKIMGDLSDEQLFNWLPLKHQRRLCKKFKHDPALHHFALTMFSWEWIHYTLEIMGMFKAASERDDH
jgi:hypothetical protein